VIFINPSNPTGAVFKQDHMERLVELCELYKIPIIADEIYAGMTFNDSPFVSFCQIAKRIPIIHVGGLAKRFLVPGMCKINRFWQKKTLKDGESAGVWSTIRWPFSKGD
jgi:aspartate/methionine/tyrosine aminotransferase